MQKYQWVQCRLTTQPAQFIASKLARHQATITECVVAPWGDDGIWQTMAIIFPHPQYSVRTHSHTSCSPLEIEDKIAVSQLNSELSSYQQICKLWISLYDPGGQRAGDLATGGLGPGHQPPVTPPTTHPVTEFTSQTLDTIITQLLIDTNMKFVLLKTQI